MTDVIVDFKGLDQISKKLKLLPDRFAARGMRRALRKGANVIRNAARNNAKRFDDPLTKEAIYKNVAVMGGSSRREKAAGGPIMRVGMRGGARFNPTAGNLPGGNTTGYWRFLEFGTADQAAQPFLRPALTSSASAALAAIVEAADGELDKEVARL